MPANDQASLPLPEAPLAAAVPSITLHYLSDHTKYQVETRNFLAIEQMLFELANDQLNPLLPREPRHDRLSYPSLIKLYLNNLQKLSELFSYLKFLRAKLADPRLLVPADYSEILSSRWNARLAYPSLDLPALQLKVTNWHRETMTCQEPDINQPLTVSVASIEGLHGLSHNLLRQRKHRPLTELKRTYLEAVLTHAATLGNPNERKKFLQAAANTPLARYQHYWRFVGCLWSRPSQTQRFLNQLADLTLTPTTTLQLNLVKLNYRDTCFRILSKEDQYPQDPLFDSATNIVILRSA